jgi:hypothetical protein
MMRRGIRKWGCAAGLAALGIACSHTTAPIASPLTITTTQPSVAMVHDPSETSFSISATLTNTSQMNVYLDGCLPIAQRQIGGVWITVFDIDCE